VLRAPPRWTPQIVEFVQLVNAAWDASGRRLERRDLTSWYRDAATNARVGGMANSQHQWGLALDVLPNARGRAFARAAGAIGLIVINEGDHFHIQRFPGGTCGAFCGPRP
jgi:hypothetical protein